MNMATQRRKTITDESKEMRVAGYIRVSSQEQADSGLGLEAQTAKVNAMAMVKGWTQPTIYSDAGVSGTVEPMKRNGMAMLLQDIQAGKIDALIVLSLDRLGRKSKIILDLVETFKKHGVILISTKESFDSSTAMGTFALQMIASVAELERNLISERTTAALNVRKEKHGYASGKLPMGYSRVVNGDIETIVINEDEAAIVKRIFNLKRSGKYSLRKIADAIKCDAINCGPSTIKYILDNADYYKGKVEYFPKII
jgi:site-specific DNA recombinase